MKRFSLKKVMSVVMTGAVLLGFTGCLGLGGGNKKAVIEAADVLASDMVSASASKLIKNSTLDKKSSEATNLTELLDDSSASDDQKALFKAIEGTIEYEISEESCEVKKDAASVDIVFTIADYDSVLKDDFSDIDEVTSAIKKAKTKEFTFTAEFVKEEKEWIPDNVGSKKFMKFYDYRNVEVNFEVTDAIVLSLIDYQMSDFWLVGDDGCYMDTSFIEYDLYFNSEVYKYENRGVYLTYRFDKNGTTVYTGEPFLFGESTSVSCRMDTDSLSLGLTQVMDEGTYDFVLSFVDGQDIFITSVEVKQTPKPTPNPNGDNGSNKTFPGEGEYFDFYDKSFKDYVIEAKWFDYDGCRTNAFTYNTDVQTIGFSLQVTENCTKRLDYFYAYSATDSDADIKAALNNPIYKNSVTPQEYDNGYFYDLDYAVDGNAEKGYYLLVVSDATTGAFVVYGYCEVS